MSKCQNNPNESSTTEINKHVLSGYWLFTHCSFDKTKNKLDYYRGVKDCMEKFCKDLREHATKTINYEKKKMIPLTKEEKINHNGQEICYIFVIDYRHGNNVFKRFKLKNLGEYHDLYVQSDTLLLADVFENFTNTCLKVYELDPAHFLSLPGLPRQACLKKTNIKLELLTDYDILLMVEEGIRGGI